jgi:hypothetical protein
MARGRRFKRRIIKFKQIAQDSLRYGRIELCMLLAKKVRIAQE